MTTPSKTTTNETQLQQTHESNYDCLPLWSDLDAKKEVFVTIINRITMDPELGQKYVDCPEEARNDIKKLIQVPDEVKIVFLPAGDSDMDGGGSVVIELPPPSRAELSVPEKLELFLCTYNPW